MVTGINRTQGGFSMIDLLSTMVIVGVMAVTAVPAYIDFRGAARTRVMDDLMGKASYQAEASRLYFIAKGGDPTSPNAGMAINGTNIFFKYGYPTDDATGLSRLVSFGGAVSFPGQTAWVIAAGVTGCDVRYFAPSGVGFPATLASIQSGC